MSFGKIYLIGAGPGAKDLITVRGATLLSKAHAVFYDALVDPAILDFAPHAEKFFVGKRARQPAIAQTDINTRLIDWAKNHPDQIAVRLKGGDAMIFGRADEEIRALVQSAIAVEVVPGITAASAASARLMQSLTLREWARSAAFCTFASANPYDDPLPPLADTLAIYMGGQNACAIARRLLGLAAKYDHYRALWNADTPVILAQAVSTANERFLSTHLQALADNQTQTWIVPQLPTLILLGQAFGHLPSLHNAQVSETLIGELGATP